MSIDTAGLLIAVTSAGVLTNIPVIPLKKKWSIQVEGCYDLLYEFINKDYPTRSEMMVYLFDLFMKHNSSKHNRPGNPIISEINRQRMWVPYGKSGVTHKGKSKIATIGYGV